MQLTKTKLTTKYEEVLSKYSMIKNVKNAILYPVNGVTENNLNIALDYNFATIQFRYMSPVFLNPIPLHNGVLFDMFKSMDKKLEIGLDNSINHIDICCSNASDIPIMVMKWFFENNKTINRMLKKDIEQIMKKCVIVQGLICSDLYQKANSVSSFCAWLYVNGATNKHEKQIRAKIITILDSI